ncbi:hypothetical protein L211DRAFT_854310 [Terfezia boudieri ATCC MYA-4762]|uniref:Uncharacterized protein n=1 Tax=Terfezia boudieri ATCC MYA-4762 TaxID=1051890 RepID=A0A3N4L5V9_9PEZI|nr:hypothetical protein L211DRAFT_854310 [Terfezia boudieri ATCC MYA-4762]
MSDQRLLAPKNIKTRSGTGSAGGGKGFVRPQVIQTLRKVVDDEEEEGAPTYIKTKIGTGSVGAVMNFEENDEEEEEAPAYIKAKSRRRYVGGSKGPMGGQGSSRSKEMVKMSAVKITRVHREEEDEEEEEVAADEEGQEEEVEENKV